MARRSLITVVLLLLYAGVQLVRQHGMLATQPPTASDVPRRPASEHGSNAVPIPKRRPEAMAWGTAFAVTSDGTWVTARHVVDDCWQTLLFAPPKLLFKGRSYTVDLGNNRVEQAIETRLVDKERNGADIALLKTENRRVQPMLLANKNDYEVIANQEGYAVGFPNTEPGQVMARLIGKNYKLHGVG